MFLDESLPFLFVATPCGQVSFEAWPPVKLEASLSSSPALVSQRCGLPQSWWQPVASPYRSAKCSVICIFAQAQLRHGLGSVRNALPTLDCRRGRSATDAAREPPFLWLLRLQSQGSRCVQVGAAALDEPRGQTAPG